MKVVVELDGDMYAVVYNAVEAMARQSRALCASLDDEYVLHRHHQRHTAAAETAELREVAADTVREHEAALHALHRAVETDTGVPQQAEGLVFSAALTATVRVGGGRDLGDAVDALRGIQALAPSSPWRLADGITVTRVSLGYAGRVSLVWLPADDAAVDVSRMQQPHRCQTCGQVYDETDGGGEAGRCPDCADQQPGTL